MRGPEIGTLVLLVRHGLTPTTGRLLPGRAPGLHLSDAGQSQAGKLAKRLAKLPLAALYSSPLERARETAAPTASEHGLGIFREATLLECDFGEWTGRELVELAKLPEWDAVQRTPSTFRFPGGESFAEMQTRIVAGIERLRGLHAGESIACFSHADPIKVALAHYLGTPLDSFQRIAIDTASVSALWFTGAGASVLTTNTRSGALAGLRPA